MTFTEQLCFSCRKACRKRCSWTRDGVPPEGSTYQKNRNGYLITECPEFEEGRGLPRELDTEGTIRLMQSALQYMRDDYVRGYGPHTITDRYHQKRFDIPKNRLHIEKWLTSKQGRQLTELSDPETVIKMLRKLARRHDQMRLKG